MIETGSQTIPKTEQLKIQLISQVNRLINDYRVELTDNIPNERGGFEVKKSFANYTLCLNYKGKIIHILHVGGNVCGLLYNKDTPDEQGIYFGNLKTDLVSPDIANRQGAIFYLAHRVRSEIKNKLTIAAIKQEIEANLTENPRYYDSMPIETDNFRTIQMEVRSGGKKDIRQYQEGISNFTQLSLRQIDNHLSTIFNPSLGNFGQNQAYTKTALDTLLLVCSECAKNSVLQIKLIAELTKSEPYEDTKLAPIFVQAGKKCDNGKIGYLNPGSEIDFSRITIGLGYPEGITAEQYINSLKTETHLSCLASLGIPSPEKLELNEELNYLGEEEILENITLQEMLKLTLATPLPKSDVTVKLPPRTQSQAFTSSLSFISGSSPSLVPSYTTPSSQLDGIIVPGRTAPGFKLPKAKAKAPLSSNHESIEEKFESLHRHLKTFA